MALAGVPGVAVRTVEIRGGDKYEAALARIVAKVENGSTVKVGFLDTASYPGGVGKQSLKVAQVAFWNEFGTRRTPARPFFRSTIQRQGADWGIKLAKAMRYYELDSRKALSALGLHIKDQITEAIATWSSPPNSPRTVAKKGFNKPLIDTGVMQRSVDYKVT